MLFPAAQCPKNPYVDERDVMLVLSRKRDENIIIGDNICVVVISVHRTRIKLGIEGLAEVPIQRLELLDSEIAALRKVDQHDHRSKLPVAVLG